jgi:hypothetical protein
LASSVPEASTGGIGLCSETMSASPVEVGVEIITYERHMLRVVPSQEKTPRRRGRPRKDKGKWEENHLPAELSVHPTAEGSMMITNLSEPIETNSRRSGRQKGKGQGTGFSR